LREKEYDSKRKKLIDDLVKRENESLGKQKDTVERNFEVFFYFIKLLFLNLFKFVFFFYIERTGTFKKRKFNSTR